MNRVFGGEKQPGEEKRSRHCGALLVTGLGEETRVGEGTEDGPRQEKTSAKKII